MGQTGFPKPNYCTHKSMLALMTGGAAEYPSFSALPLYHGFGHHSGLRCMYFGVPFTLFFPHLPLTAANITRCWKTSTMPQMKETQLAAVPYVLKVLHFTVSKLMRCSYWPRQRKGFRCSLPFPAYLLPVQLYP